MKLREKEMMTGRRRGGGDDGRRLQIDDEAAPGRGRGFRRLVTKLRGVGGIRAEAGGHPSKGGTCVVAAGIGGGVGPMGSGFAPIQIGQRREREECEGRVGRLGFRSGGPGR